MIEIRGLQKFFGTHHVLKGVDASVAKGEVVCIIGPSGSGKSTILRCINGLESYSGGTIDIDGVHVDHQAPSIKKIRTEVAMVFQRFNLFPHRSVLENIIEGPVFVKGEPRAAAIDHAKELLASVGLAEKIDARPSQLSGGQQQRVAIARALVSRPPLILADEPTGNLDSVTSIEIMKLLPELQASGMTIVFVTHEPDIAAYAARKLLLKDGAVVSDLRQQPMLLEAS